MIRLIQRRLIIPRGDTGSFSIPVIKKGGTDNIAVFTIFDDLTRTKMFQKEVVSEGDVITIAFTHNDTVNLKPGKYYWDIKYYSDPQYVDEELVNGSEIDSYYAGYKLPVCEIRETADNYLVSPDAPTATLSPTQLDIITSAINGLNEAIRKTNENVEHYPEIRDEVWYVWDAELGDYVSTDVPANGVVGNGIESAVLNNDYTLTLNFTDGTSFTSSSIRGETGNGIDDIVLNNDFTLTISYTDGESYTTPSIRGPVGATPQFSIGTVQEGAVAAASITGTAENPVLNLTLPNANVPTRVSELENDAGYLSDVQVDGTSIVDNGVADIPIATTSSYGLISIAPSGGLSILTNPINEQNQLYIVSANNTIVKAGTNSFRAVTPAYQHASTFYGLAKAAGDTTQSQSSNAVGTYTNEAKAAIQTMLDVPSNADVAAKQDTLTFDSTPTANSTNPVTSGGVYNAIANVNTMKIHICAQGEYDSETGIPTIQNPDTQTFYLVPGGEGSNLFIEWAYVNNAWERFGSADVEIPVQDVQVDGTSVVSNGVAEIPIASKNTPGVAKISAAYGLKMDNNYIKINPAVSNPIKDGLATYNSIVPYYQHESTFYGLAKAAGADMKDISSTTVGVYPDAQKTAIRSMLGATSDQIVAVQDTTPTDPDTKLWINETPASTVQVPTVAEMNTALSGKVSDVQVNGTSVVSNGVADVPIADTNVLGVVRPYTAFGIGINATTGQLFISAAALNNLKAGTDNYKPVVSSNEHTAAFFGLSKAAGVDLANETVTVGTYPETSKTAIRGMLGAVGDVQVNGTSVVSGGVANVPVASASTPGVAKVSGAMGIDITNGFLTMSSAEPKYIQQGSHLRKAITPKYQHEATFYGLAKAAGHDEKNSTEPVGTYTPEAKGAIQSMLGISDLIAPEENNLIASKAYAIGDVFTANGKLYKATAAIAANAAIIPAVEGEEIAGANCVETSAGEGFVKFTDYATAETAGIVKVNGNYGIVQNGGVGGALQINYATVAQCKNRTGSTAYQPLTVFTENAAAFYGLAYAAGDTTMASSTNAVGTYTTEAKTAIRAMIGAENGDDIVKVQDTQPTTAATKIWLPETPPESIAVPTVAEMETALAGKVSDVQVNGTSIVTNGVANVPVGNDTNPGVFKVGGYGVGVYNYDLSKLCVKCAQTNHIKAGTDLYMPIVSGKQHESTFYGLAKAAGDTSQSQSSNAVGNYTPSAKGAIQRMIGLPDIIAPDESSGDASRVYAEGEIFTMDGTLYRATEAIAQDEAIVPPIEMMGNLEVFNCEPVTIGNYFIRDVQINGTSIGSNGIANIPVATTSSYGAVQIGYGLRIVDNRLSISPAVSSDVKTGTATMLPIVPHYQHESTFYGLAKAAGDTTQSASNNAVGTYTDSAKASIKSMLGIVDGSTSTVNVSGAAPTITAVENTRYVCGEVTSLNITPAASGICIVRFTSGTTPTVLTLPSTVKFPEWFDYSTLETDTIYEMCITDGIYGAVMSWAL